MRPKSFMKNAGLAVILTLGTTNASFADGIQIEDPYARAASPSAMAGAAFMSLTNETDTADRLIEVRSDVAKRIELHTHVDAGDGVMQMREIEGGIVLAPGETRLLERGGDHVMFMGLNRSLLDGESVTLTFVFEQAGEVEAEVPVDLSR